MSQIATINPTTEEVVKIFPALTESQILIKLEAAQTAFLSWRKTTFAQRAKILKAVAAQLRARQSEIAQAMTLEMGKTIVSAEAEVEKCAWVCEYYADNDGKFLQPEKMKSDYHSSVVEFQPLGIIYAVMPWNFPFWQVFRFAAPALMAGNVGVLKHASNVPQCSLLIEDIFRQAGTPAGVFTSLLINVKGSEVVVRHSFVKAVTLTGSEAAGSSVAGQAGQSLKKTVLELGGSDPFIVLDDADVIVAAKTAAESRLLNAGQSCICAKRFIVHEKIAEQFTLEFVKQVESFTIGNPTDRSTKIGPLASAQIRDTIAAQVDASVKMGARILTGGKKIEGKGFFYKPTVLDQLEPGMPAYDQETFGPVASIIVVKDDEEALQVANNTPYGLAASLWTKDKKRAAFFAENIEAGSVFVNAMVKSDPRLPFGGVKLSGYGRELSSYGIKEFVNVKTVVKQ